MVQFQSWTQQQHDNLARLYNFFVNVYELFTAAQAFTQEARVVLGYGITSLLTLMLFLCIQISGCALTMNLLLLTVYLWTNCRYLISYINWKLISFCTKNLKLIEFLNYLMLHFNLFFCNSLFSRETTQAFATVLLDIEGSSRNTRP